MLPPIQVLLVEDDSSIQALLSTVIADLGMTVVGAVRGEEAAKDWLDHAQSWQLAIVDINLSDGAGFGVVRRLRKDNLLSRIIVFSDTVTPLLHARCIAFGADAAFAKEDLADLVRYLKDG